MDYHPVDFKRERYREVHTQMEAAAGRVSCFSELAKELRQLNHWCSMACNFPVDIEAETKAKGLIPVHYGNVLSQCDAITRRG